MTAAAIASLPLDYARIPETGRATSPGALRRRRAITHVDDRHDGLDIDNADHLDELRKELPSWPGRDQMLAIIDKIIDHPAITEARGHRIGRDGLRAIWVNDVIDAAQSGGLLRTTRRHAAVRAGYTGKDGDRIVQHARSIGRRAGLYIELYRGRHLTLAERLTLWHDHDQHRQQGFPSAFAIGVFTPEHAEQFTTPKPGHFAELRTADSPQSEEGTPPLRSRSLFDLPHLLQMLTSSAAPAARGLKTKGGCTIRRKPRAGLGLAIDLMTDPVLSRIFAGVRPGHIAGQLKSYEQGGWRAGALAAALLREASTLRVSLWEPARSPFGLLKALLRGVGILPDVDAAVYGALPQAQPATPPAEPCGGADCDGHGWINGVTDAGYSFARPCPDCPPQIRGGHYVPAVADYDGDVPF